MASGKPKAGPALSPAPLGLHGARSAAARHPGHFPSPGAAPPAATPGPCPAGTREKAEVGRDITAARGVMQVCERVKSHRGCQATEPSICMDAGADPQSCDAVLSSSRPYAVPGLLL